MSQKLALKRLTRSDLTLFEWQFRNVNAGNQKAINLNADVFVGHLFPGLPAEAASRSGKFPLDLDVFGPSGAPRINLQRKIIKFGEYKNWRLDGEFIANPIDHPERFNQLKEGDFALMEFSGVHFPESARLVLISRSGDPSLHAACESFLGARNMGALSGDELDNILRIAQVEEVFPVTGANLEAVLEDAAMGGVEGTRRLLRRALVRAISKEELRAARNQTDELGMVGEEFVNDHLDREKSSGRVRSFSWDSLSNAVSPFDFTVEASNGVRHRLDVKTTRGAFANRIHISTNELLYMRDDPFDYRIYRVYEIKGNRAMLRISESTRAFATQVIPILETLPRGVSVDGISLDPKLLQFGQEAELEQQEENI